MSHRARIGAWIESPLVQRVIIALIVINAVTLGLETSATVMAHSGPALKFFDHVVLAVFVLEIGAKLFAFRLAFFRNAWNLFDFIIVGIALIPASGPLAVLRALRVLRVLRLISGVPRLRFVVEALLQAVPGISSIAALMLLLFYVFAVMSTSLFGPGFPDWFGSIGASMYTLFQVMTLESWSMGIVRPIMDAYPYAWAFFIPFILIATFTMLNLFIAIIVNAMQTFQEQEHQETVQALHETQDHIESELHAEMRSLRAEMKELRALLGSRSGS